MGDTAPAIRSQLEVQLFDEVNAMADYALGSGVAMPDSVVSVVMEVQRTGDARLDPATWVRLENAHEVLSRALAPATPQALKLLHGEAQRQRPVAWLPSLGPVPLVRQLTVAGLLFLVGFILLGLSSSVSRNSGGILDSSGSTLLLNLLFVLCASGLGAVFAALFKVNGYIANRTYDPIYESSYWVNIVLGLIGGLLLAELLLEVLDTGSDGEAAGAPFARPLLALIGGFSAKVVFQILNRLVEAVGSVFKGDSSELVAANAEAARAKLLAQQTEDRIKLSNQLVQLQQTLNSGASPEQLAASVNGMLDDLLPFATANPASPVAPNGSRPPGAAGSVDQLDTTRASGATGGASVSASSATVSGAPTGVDSEDGAQISGATGGASVSASSATVSGAPTGVDSEDGAQISGATGGAPVSTSSTASGAPAGDALRPVDPGDQPPSG